MQAVDNAERSEHKCNFGFSLSSDTLFTVYLSNKEANKRGKERERKKRVLKCYTFAAGAIVFLATGAIARRAPRFRALSRDAFAGFFTFVNRIMLITRVYVFSVHYAVPANSTAHDTATPFFSIASE